MPKNTVTQNTVNDPITDQEISFAHLVLSGTMNDRQAAEVAGLNPDTAAYTKSQPRVRDYMIEHRNAVTEKLIDQEPTRPGLQRTCPRVPRTCPGLPRKASANSTLVATRS
jgi:hypothetical protein